MCRLSLAMLVLIGVSPATLAMGHASDQELATVFGQDWLTSCCVPYGGGTCSWEPPPYSAAECGMQGFPQQCAVEGGGNQCYVIDVGPSASDTCHSSQNWQDSCSLAIDGWCVSYKLGGCVQHRNEMFFPIGCYCENLGNAYHVGTRNYCAAGSTNCPAIPR